MRVPTGCRGMDRLLDGGVPANRLYVISGPPGSGKTTFASQFITEGARNDETSLYITMHETREELIQDMASFEFGFEQAITAKNARFLNLTSEKARMSLTKYGTEGGLTNRVAAMIEEIGVDRAVIDSTMLLTHFVEDPDNALTEFATRLKQTDATIILISEMTDPSAYSAEHFLAHGVIFFHNFMEAGGMQRAVQVIKMRGTDIDCDMHAVSFSSGGIAVHPDQKVDQVR
ncbi:ATPase domain-containing protein [Halanaeroarchaeum sp. HSR-CO]|uniref:RAD55 family ATPase n=1 Tax=Halanaeroarchaeum sp. HSR-CO TaxID=2866382 RepID=UPI00217E8F10|nr:ATPase domain-containing protein [Halanaeroarchaeum sp. HSR-CO]